MLIAVFDNPEAAEAGMDRLEEQGVPSESVRYLRGSHKGRPGTASNANEAGSAALGEAAIAEKNAPFLPPGADRESPLEELGVDAEVRDYLQRILSEGGRLVAVDVGEGALDEVTETLREAGATQVTTS